MKFLTGSAIFFAASIALAVASPARSYYRPVNYDSEEYSEGSALLAARQPYTLATAPFFYQPRGLEAISSTGRKYQIVKRKKKPNQGAPLPGSDEDEDEEPQDEEDDDESSEEEADEEGGGGGDEDEESLDVPPWEELFPEEDKNTGTFNDGPGGGYGGQGGQGNSGGSLANLPSGGPAPESGGSLMNLFSGAFGGSSENQEGPQSDLGGGGPPQYRQNLRPRRPVPKSSRGRTSLPSVEEPRTGGAVLYDGYNYIPVKPVHVRIPQRESKTIKENKNKSPLPAPVTTTSRQNKKLKTNKPKYVLVPVDRDSREIRFSRDEHGFNVEHGPIYAPSEIWRWEGPGGRPLRRRENRPAGVFYTARPQRGSNVRFSEDDDY